MTLRTSSYYYRAKFQTLAVTPSYLFLEFLAEVIANSPGVSMLVALQSATIKTYGKPKNLNTKELTQLAEQLTDDTKKRGEPENADTKIKLGMGTQCIEWLSKLPPQDLCMLLGGYDPVKTEELYCFTDYRVVSEMGRLYVEDRWHQIQSQHDAAMYAFGGGYKGEGDASSPGGDKGEVAVVDLTKPNSAAYELLKQSGF